MASTDLAPSTAPTDPTSARVPTRRVSFEESIRDLPKHFAADGDLVMSHVIASLSSVFPDGEDFFVRSVRHFRDQITEPVLRQQVAGFIGQEAMHGRSHRAFNGRLDELGYPARRIERFTRRGLALRERVMSPASNLAATSALEHFTATLAEALLNSEACRAEVGHPAVQDLLLWHALEESEHKAVAFDVYRQVGGTERLRVFTMNAVTVGFVVGMTLQTLVSMLGDRDTYRPKVVARSFGRLRSSPFLTRELWRTLRDYNRSDFHPDDHDSSELIALWRDELFGEDGRLRDNLISASA